MTKPEPKVRVLIVDDSSMMRHLLADMLATDTRIEVVGVAVDPYDARQKLIDLRPDVMTLDVEMPKMDGVTFLEKVMKHFPIRTVIVSSLTQQGSALALRALECGAIDVIAKPKLDVTRGMKEMAAEISARVLNAAGAKLMAHTPKPLAQVVSFQPVNRMETTHKVIALAASTGGTEALKVLLSGMPKEGPGLLVVQHMPPIFTRNFAEALKTLTGLDVREAKEGDQVVPGSVLIAPGGFHMEAVRKGAFYHVHLHQGDLVQGLRPSADCLMRSVAQAAGSNAVGIVLTGMGTDSAQGLLEMKKAGAFTLAQDEESSVIFGMPREAIRLGAVDRVLPLNQIAGAVIEHLSGAQAKAA